MTAAKPKSPDPTPTLPETITEALIAVRKLVGTVGKDETNEHFGFSFRGYEGVTNAVSPALNEVGVLMTPHSVKTVMPVGNSVLLVMIYRFSFGGDTLDVEVAAQAADAIKAMSVAARIAMIQSLSLPTKDPEATAFVAQVIDPAFADAQQTVANAWAALTGRAFDLPAMQADYEQTYSVPLSEATAGDLLRYAEELAERFAQQAARIAGEAQGS